MENFFLVTFKNFATSVMGNGDHFKSQKITKAYLNLKYGNSSIKKPRPITNRNTVICTQPAFTCSKLTIERLEQGVKYVQSQQ